MLMSVIDTHTAEPRHGPCGDHLLSSCVSEELLGSVGSSSSLAMSSEDRLPRL